MDDNIIGYHPVMKYCMDCGHKGVYNMFNHYDKCPYCNCELLTKEESEIVDDIIGDIHD